LIPKELKHLYREYRLIPFVGAGASMSIEWIDGNTTKRGPSWGELVDQAARELGFLQPDLLRVRGTDIQILEYFKYKMGSTGQLKKWLIQNLNPPDNVLQGSLIHKALAGLEKCDLFYTTNFDDFIERSFKLNGRPCRSVAVERDILGKKGGEPEIVKFHGDLEHPEEMVLSESDYQHRMAFTGVMDFRLRSDLLNRAVLFIGYSFRDINVAYLFRLVNDLFRELPNTPHGRRAFIVTADPSDFEQSLFRNRNIEVIPIGAARQTEEVAGVLNELTR